ncbi:MAG: hypothetical protein IT230_01910 [Flavobacteriales bacterium]|nr:hypothetical protein [Flavobacteriales bacterium]
MSTLNAQKLPQVQFLDHVSTNMACSDGYRLGHGAYQGRAYNVYSCDGKLEIVGWDPNSTNVEFRHVTDSPFNKDEHHVISEVVGLDGTLWVIFLSQSREKREGEYNIDALPLNPATGEPGGALVHVGEVNFRASIDAMLANLYNQFKFVPSPDRKGLLIMFDAMVDQDQHSMLCAWVVNKDMVKQWSAIFRLPARGRASKGILDDHGNAYAVYNEGFEFSVEGSKKNRTHHVLLLTEKGYGPLESPQPVERDQLIRATAALMPDGTLMLGGLLLKKNGSVSYDNVHGLFFQRLDKDLKPMGEPSWKEVPDTDKHAMSAAMELIPRPDGGVFMVAETRSIDRYRVDLVVASSDANGQTDWTWTTPIGQPSGATVYYDQQELDPLVHLVGNELYVLHRNAPINFQRIAEGKGPKRVIYAITEPDIEVLHCTGGSSPERWMLDQQDYELHGPCDNLAREQARHYYASLKESKQIQGNDKANYKLARLVFE